MGLLSTDEVNTIANSLLSRASAAIDSLEEKKSFMGSVFGNNDTINSTQGALIMIRDKQIPPWRDRGLSIAANEDDDLIGKWKSLGQDFANAINEIDGYGKDASLESVVTLTAKQTGTDTVKMAGQVASVIPFQVWIGLAVVGGIILLFSVGPALISREA